MSPPNSAKEAYIAVGSNINPGQNVLKAGKALLDLVDIISVSNLYLSAPKGNSNQEPFINGVFRIATPLDPKTLKYRGLRKIEADLGRVRTGDKNAPRTMDLDLIVYADDVIESNELTLPDPDIYRYNHIAVPLLEVGPLLVLPDRHTAVEALASAHNKKGLTLLSELSKHLKGIIENGRKTRR